MTVKLRAMLDEPSLAAAGADIVCDVVRAVPNAVVTFATGLSAAPIYKALAERVDRRDIDFSRVRVFELDGYLGIPLEDRRSLFAWLMRDVIVPLQIPEHAVTRLRGEASDPVASCREYDRALDRAGGYDLALLGLGPNGHVAFNEPPADPASDARAGRDRGERRERHPLLGLAGGGAPPREGDADPMTPASLLNRSADVTFLTDLPIR